MKIESKGKVKTMTIEDMFGDLHKIDILAGRNAKAKKF